MCENIVIRLKKWTKSTQSGCKITKILSFLTLLQKTICFCVDLGKAKRRLVCCFVLFVTFANKFVTFAVYIYYLYKFVFREKFTQLCDIHVH